jgi:hypothetical protein
MLSSIKQITATYHDGSVFTGTGWRHNGPHGEGKIQYGNGDIYDGGFENGLRCGYGAFYGESGETYSGHWLCNTKHGYGQIYVPNQYEYDGEWFSDMMHGRGTWTDLNTKCVRTGTWDNNKQNGYGTITESRSYYILYAGNIVNNSINGIGCVIYRSGASYQGEWRNGRRHGHGRFIYSDGSEEVGFWVNDIYRGTEIPEYNVLSDEEEDDEM